MFPNIRPYRITLSDFLFICILIGMGCAHVITGRTLPGKTDQSVLLAVYAQSPFLPEITMTAIHDSSQSIQVDDPLESPNNFSSVKPTFRIGSVCPNPVKTEGVVLIEWIEPSVQSTAIGHLCNIRGDVVENYTRLLQTSGSTKIVLPINAADLANGIYFLCITAQNYSALSPVVVVK